MARRAVEEKAEQLALTSKYKSEFLANMSHELRTPLNSLLILSKLLADNQQGNLNEKQTEFARTIHGAGTDLLSLINDILDLSKIESGTVSIEIGDMPLASLKQHMERTFRQLASEKEPRVRGRFRRRPAGRPSAPTRSGCSRSCSTCCRTPSSSPPRAASRSRSGWRTAAGAPTHPVLRERRRRRSRSRSRDTGIGIPEDKQKLIFEAFQQADGTTSRKYGGTGLGLSISREIAGLLGGELQVRSTPGEGSTFTLYVPLKSPGVAPALALPSRRSPTRPAPTASSAASSDDRDDLGDQPFVLIVEDDPTFAGILLDLAHEAGLKGVISLGGLGHAGDGAQDAAERDHARPRPQRHRRLRAARPAAPRSRKPRHPGLRHLGRRAGRARAHARARREVIEKPAEPRASSRELFGSIAETAQARRQAQAPQARRDAEPASDAPGRAGRQRASSSSTTTSATSTR